MQMRILHGLLKNTTNLSVSINGSRVATITANDVNWNGSETIRFIATDQGGLQDSTDVTFTINAVNDNPVVSTISNQTINEGNSFSTITLDNVVSDVEDADADITWSTKNTTNLSVSINSSQVATITANDVNWNGSETIRFIATDQGGLQDSTDVTFTVNPVNDQPTLTAISNPAAIDEDASVNKR